MGKRRKHVKIEEMYAAGKKRQRDRRKELRRIAEDFKFNLMVKLI